MRGTLLVLLVAMAAVPSACGSAKSPTRPGIEADATIPITGSERLGWSQPGGSLDEVSALRFRLSIDGTPVELTGVSCAPAAAAGRYDCSAPLPRLSAGRHVLSLSAVDGSGLDGPASATLVVFVSGS